MAKVLVSACLIGQPCRFDGGARRSAFLVEALERSGAEPVPFCPEEAGGLGTPRPAALLVGGDGAAVLDGNARVWEEQGREVTKAFLDGARATAETAVREGCAVAYLKERSPSCGSTRVHTDRGVVPGRGVTAALLHRYGIAIVSID